MRPWLALVLVAFAPATAEAQEIPREAVRYQRQLMREAQAVWGLKAPIALFAAQIHQESGWRADARSKFAGGLAQFTPDTAAWIGSAYKDLAGAEPFNPSWAMRAMVRYDRHLFDRIEAVSPCDQWAMTLSAYNGGLGWLKRDKALTLRAGLDPLRWWENVELHSPRADWAIRENRGYPRRIMLDLQSRYHRWGAAVPCP